MAANKASEQVRAREEDKKGIFGFFAKFLPKDKKIVLEDDPEYKNETIGQNEPTINQKMLETISTFITNSNISTGSRYSGASQSIQNFAPLFNSKKAKIIAYKSMYQYPEINRATGIVINEALSRDVDGEIIKLNIHQVGDTEVPMAVQEIMNSAFEYLCHDIYDVERNIHNWFKKYLIEGEIYIELIYDPKEETIVGVNVLPSYSMAPIFQDNTNNIIGYTQFEDVIINGIEVEEKHDDYDPVMGQNNKHYLNNSTYGITGDSGNQMGPIEFISNQIAYANSGSYSTSVYDVDGYYAPIRKTFNQLSTVDDALAIYRFVRAPETRLWNIYTGNLPPSKVDNYVENVITEFRKDFNYDPSSGAIMQDTMFSSIVDDFFFAQDGNGNKTSVETLSGAMNLDQLSDVMYYKEKLYAGLHIPKSYWDPAAETVINSTRESVRKDEMELTYFVEQFQNNFIDIFTGPFETLLRIMGVDEKWINKKFYTISFAKRNSWQFWQDNARLTAQATLYAALLPFAYNPTENPNGQFAPKYLWQRSFQLSANEEQINADMLEEYKNSLKPDYKAPAQTWDPGLPEYENKYDYERDNFIYGSYDEGDLEYNYGNNDDYSYKSDLDEDSNVQDVLTDIDEYDMGDQEFDNDDFLYGGPNTFVYGSGSSDESFDSQDFLTGKKDIDTNFNDDQYLKGEHEFSYGNEFLYGLKKEKRIKDQGDILDEITFDTLDITPEDEEELNDNDVYNFGSDFNYGQTFEVDYDYNDKSLEELEDQSPEDFTYGNKFPYGNL